MAANKKFRRTPNTNGYRHLKCSDSSEELTGTGSKCPTTKFPLQFIQSRQKVLSEIATYTIASECSGYISRCHIFGRTAENIWSGPMQNN
jgi:hypothetical protein